MSPSRFSSRRFQLVLIVAALLIAALLRTVNLSRLPAGLDSAEIATLRIAETARMGAIAPFYNVGEPGDVYPGHEGLFGILQSIIMILLNSGLFSYHVLPLWCGLVSVALTYALTRRLFGPFAGLAAALVLAANLWAVLLSRSVIPETLLLPLTLALLLTMTRAFHLTDTIGPETPETPFYALLGILIVVMAYTHWTGLIAGPLLIFYVIYLFVTRQPISRRVAGFITFALLIAIIFAIPYLTSMLRAFSLSGFHAVWVSRPPNLGVFLLSVFQVVAGVVFSGDPLPQHNLPGFPLLGPLGGFLLLVGLFAALQRRRAPNMAFILLALVMGLLPAIWAHSGPDFSTMTVALPALAALTGLGAEVVALRLWRTARTHDMLRSAPALVATAALTVISVLIVGALLLNQWGNDPAVDLAYRGQLGRLAAYLDRTHDNLTTAICTFNLDSSSSLSDRALLNLLMYREDKTLRFSDCLTGFILTRGGQPQRVAFAAPDVAGGISPQFQPWLRNAPPVIDPELKPGEVVRIDVAHELADVLGKLTQAPISWTPGTSGPSAQAVLPVRMGGYLTFEGYMLDTARVYEPGDTVSLITFWRADGDQIPDLRVFAHILRNPNTEPLVQNDTLSTDASMLRDRDVFIQIINIPLPASFPSGEFYVSVGAYSSETSQRLPVYDNNQPRGDRLFLSTIKVGE